MPKSEMIFHIGPYDYRPVITKKRLRDIHGKVSEAQACEASRTLKVSHRVKPERREELLRHENYHAWLFCVAEPRDEEGAAQFNALTGAQFQKDFLAGGGAAVLMAMQPADEADPEPEKPLEGLELLRKVRYPGLSDEHWAYFLELCREKDVNPWSDQLTARLMPDPATNSFRLALITTIEFLRSRALKSNDYAGMDAPIERVVNGKLVAVETTIYRMVHGARCGFTAVAKYEEYAPYAMGDFADKMPTGWLEKCSESKVLKRAFADELGMMYSQEEMMQIHNRPRQPRPPRPQSRPTYDDFVQESPHDDVPDYQHANV